MESTSPPLSKREVTLLATWERTGVHRVTTADLAMALAVSKPNAAVILARLAHKGALDHLGRGIYGVRPMRAVGVPWVTSGLVAVANLLDGRDYYVGGPIALTTHHLTAQVFHSVIDVFTTKRFLSRTKGHARLVFHTLRWPEVLHLGVIPVPVGPVMVRMSDPERTVLDLIDRPDLFGSARRALTVVRQSLGRIDIDRLIAYAQRWPRRSTRQRLGYLLEQDGVSRARLVALLHDERPNHVVPLLVDEPSRGPIHSPWRVQANDGGDVRVNVGDDG